MLKENNKILKYNHREKYMKALYVIYADLEFILEKINTCHNNPKNSSATKINKHTPSGYSLFTHCSFDVTKNKLRYYRGKDCMRKFCKDLKEHEIKIINYEKKKDMISSTFEVNHIINKKFVTYTKKEFSTDDKKVRDHCHFTGKYRIAVHDVHNLNYKAPKEIPILFHNGSLYDYHFITKELPKEFRGEFKCLGKNTEKYITSSVLTKNDNLKKYKIKFIVSFRLMPTSLLNLVDNLSGSLYSDKCTDCKSYLDDMSIKDDQLIFRSFGCK